MSETATTANEVQAYFDMCKAYWERLGNPSAVATCKAFWWDCVEVWNMDKSWNDEKKAFAKAFRGYVPGNPIPDESVVEAGDC